MGCKQMAVTNVQGLGTQPSWKKFCWEAEVVPFTVLFLPLAVADFSPTPLLGTECSVSTLARPSLLEPVPESLSEQGAMKTELVP